MSDADTAAVRRDYDLANEQLRTLTDIRFKLLAFVPTISGAAVGLLGQSKPAGDRLGVGLLGLVATLGVVLYERRNSELFERVVRRAADLERALGTGPAPRPAAHEVGLALVYGAAIAGWSYLVAWASLHVLDVGSAQRIGGILGVVAGVVVLLVLVPSMRRAESRPEAASQAPQP